MVATDALGAIAAAAVALTVDGRWDRLKICPADDCRWAFYDRSKNRFRHWCSMAECGSQGEEPRIPRPQAHSLSRALRTG